MTAIGGRQPRELPFPFHDPQESPNDWPCRGSITRPRGNEIKTVSTPKSLAVVYAR